MNKRRLVWLLFLGAAAVLALIPAFFEEPAAEAVPLARPPQRAVPVVRRGLLTELRSDGRAPAADAHRPAMPPAPSAVARARLAPGADAFANLFAAHSWEPPAPPPPAPPPAAAPAAPPPPAAPPLPFTYFGKLDDRRRVQVFLARGERVFSVGEGDVIDGAYTVKSVGDTQVTLVYLPLNLPQTLAVGSKP